MEKEYFTWEDLDSGPNELSTVLIGVECIKDFGVFKKGERFCSIFIDYENGIMEGYTEAGDPVNNQKIGLVALD